ncbi:MAG: DNA alkylation repair protein [Candidatus Omnitrophica bacterium]|nr:DNA alkylation repair protein [Candidatus Omnitrophota bacterium]
MIKSLRKELKNLADIQKAKILRGFFKTAPGEYGEGDVFLGVTVPQLRALSKKFETLGSRGIRRLLISKIHEERLLALLILLHQFQAADGSGQKRLFNFYLQHTRHINNWDLVDLTAPNIVGEYLEKRNRKVLYTLARSKLLWARRIAIVATFHFIRNGRFSDTLRIAKILLKDPEPLIHKATGWMLREVGKRDETLLKRFLKTHYHTMPRTALRYAIEKFPAELRKKYLAGTI